ncbi:hypothetical protein AMTR_s00499p00005050, partial [Amborella trichopoda]
TNEAYHNMQSECTVEVKELSKEEAWNLFLDKAGHHISSQLIEALARKVLKKCGDCPSQSSLLLGLWQCKESWEAWEDAHALRILN